MRLRRFRRFSSGNVHFRVRQLPSRHALQYTVGVLDGVHMPVVFLDHVNGSSHLLGKEIHIHAFLQSQRGIGMPEAISGARNALRSFAQIRFVQKIGNQRIVESLCRLARDIIKDSILWLRCFGDGADAF